MRGREGIPRGAAIAIDDLLDYCADPMDWKNLDQNTLNQYQEEFKEIFK